MCKRDSHWIVWIKSGDDAALSILVDDDRLRASHYLLLGEMDRTGATLCSASSIRVKFIPLAYSPNRPVAPATGIETRHSWRTI